MLSTRLLRLLTTLSYPSIAAALSRPNHSTTITADNRLTSILRLAHYDPRRSIVFNGAKTDIAAAIDELIVTLRKTPSTVKEETK